MIARRTAALFTLAALTLGACGQPDYDVATGMAAPSTTAQGVDGGTAVESAAATVRSWLTALAEGNLRAAWDLTAERSRVAIGGFDAFSGLGSDLAEGYGAWAGAPDDAFSVVPLETTGDDVLAVVILQGTMAQGGPPAPAADAVPVRSTAEGNLVEPFLDLGPVEHQPPTGTAISADSTLVALVPLLTDVHFVIDDRRVEIPPTEDAPGFQAQASVDLDMRVQPGPHSLTVVLTTAQGEIATSTALYRVEG